MERDRGKLRDLPTNRSVHVNATQMELEHAALAKCPELLRLVSRPAYGAVLEVGHM